MSDAYIIWTQDGNCTDTAHLICSNCNNEMTQIKPQTNVSDSFNTYNKYYCNKCGNTVTDKALYPHSRYNPGNSSICR